MSKTAGVKRKGTGWMVGMVMISLVGLLAPAPDVHAATWKLDTAHSNLGFSVSHLFTSVQGRFDRFEGYVKFDPAHPEATEVRTRAEAASINTNNAKRDKHLRSADFFDVKNFPELTFESSELVDWKDSRGKLKGTLTLHGISREVEFDASFVGQGSDPWGNVRAGFKATLVIDRRDYGLKWNEALETGGFLVGNEIEIRIDAEGMLVE